jgi:metal-responsive CopG/Arc/MetJ family transcriptional regulator
MTLDDDFVKAVDRVSKELCTSRSAFVRKALREALACYKLEQPKHRHRRGGYERQPAAANKFSAWESEQA